jgi:hypothetical protein
MIFRSYLGNSQEVFQRTRCGGKASAMMLVELDIVSCGNKFGAKRLRSSSCISVCRGVRTVKLLAVSGELGGLMKMSYGNAPSRSAGG